MSVEDRPDSVPVSPIMDASHIAADALRYRPDHPRRVQAVAAAARRAEALARTSKVCTSCHRSKPLEEFARDRRQLDGRASSCRACGRAEQRWRRSTLGESQRVARRERYRTEHPLPELACSECGAQFKPARRSGRLTCGDDCRRRRRARLAKDQRHRALARKERELRDELRQTRAALEEVRQA